LWPVFRLAWLCSSFLIWPLWSGCHTTCPYSRCGLTSTLYRDRNEAPSIKNSMRWFYCWIYVHIEFQPTVNAYPKILFTFYWLNFVERAIRLSFGVWCFGLASAYSHVLTFFQIITHLPC
jgi:hypothetical protein